MGMALEKRLMKIKFLIACIFMRGGSTYLKKHNIFGLCGDNVLYQPWKLPNEPKCIKLHDNVRIAQDVTFYTHDVINQMFSCLDGIPYQTHGTCIEIFDNCFIGGHSVIVGNVSIGPNVIVAAGTVVTKDIPEGVVVAGNPAKIVGQYSELHDRRRIIDGSKNVVDANLREKELWIHFYENRNRVSGDGDKNE